MILEFSCFHCLQTITSSDSTDFDDRFTFQHHNWNHHHKLPLHANFQPPTLVCSQNIGNFMFSLSSKWWRHQIRSILYVDTNFNTRIKISVIYYLYLPNLSFILYFITKILAFHVLIVFRMMMSSNLIDLTVDSNFRTKSEISIITYLSIENFSFILRYQDIVNFIFSLSLKSWRHRIWSILTVDSNFSSIIEISTINYLGSFILRVVTKI